MEITSYLLGKKSGGGGDETTGKIEITSNGTKNVKSYASANVNVQPDLESKSITITENTTTTITPTTGKDGLSSVQVTTNVSGSGVDWSAIGYSEEPQSVIVDYNYAKEIYDNWDSSISDCYRKYYNDTTIRIMPLVDTSNVTDMSEMFRGCSNLRDVPELFCKYNCGCGSMFQNCSNLISVGMTNIGNNATKMFAYCTELKDVSITSASYVTSVNSLQNMYQSCLKLTNESLDNILQMCISATQYGGTKTLAYLGITDTTAYPSSRIQALPHYQDFINAGWTIGY